LKIQSVVVDFILKDWLLIVSGVGFILTSVCTGHLPVYTFREMEVLFILLVLFVAVKGLQNSGLVAKFSQRLEKGPAVPFKLVVATFFLSMLITNDIALVVIVPLTLALNVNRLDILVILEALAANAGSALTPFGNPQNLFIYWYYHVPPGQFIMVMAPFALVFLVILMLIAFAVRTRNNGNNETAAGKVDASAFIYAILFLIVLLSVLRVLPALTGLLVIVYALLRDRRSLRIDYALLVSFFFFFGLAENMKFLLAAEIRHAGRVFLFSALVSQVTSNVPAALLFAKFTSNWKALLWGTNVGGFGSLFGSFANLIAYRLYVVQTPHAKQANNQAMFTAKFLAMGYGAFFLAIGWYFVLQGFQV